MTEALNYPAATCDPMTVAGLRVYPPNETAAAFVADPDLRVCSTATDVLGIGTVVTGSDPGPG